MVGIAQLVSAPDCGSGGPGFESQYPAELLTRIRAGDGNRTHVSSLEGWCSTIELHPHKLESSKMLPYIKMYVKRH